MTMTIAEIIKAIEPALNLFSAMQQRPGGRFSVAIEREQLGKAITALHAMKAEAQGQDAIRALIAQHSKELEHNHYAYFELAYTRQTGWMAWITDHPRSMPPTEVVKPDRKVLASGQGDTPEAACAAALAAQANKGAAA